MTTKEKLLDFRGKIEKATQFNAEFKNLIGIELFDFIHSNDLIKTEFKRRLNYLKNLANDKAFNSIQDNLFEVIQKTLKLTSLEEVKERQKEWNNALFSKLKGVEGEEKGKDVLTLPEIYVALKDKNNYYRLGDNSYFSPLSGDISLETYIVSVKKQYEGTVETFFNEVFLVKPQNDKKKDLELKKLFNEYNDYWYKFDELIYRIPVKLHFKSFEGFFSDCTEFYQRKGYEFHYNFFSNSPTRNNEIRFNKAKKNATIVIDDLIEFIEIGKERPKNNKTIKEKIPIEKITIIELKNGKYLLAVNHNYAGAKKIRKSKYYPIFIEEVAKREILNRTDNIKISDEMAEYFNHNEKCLIYMNGKYSLTTIFTGNEDNREINYEIKTELIDEDAYKKRLKKVDEK